MDLYARTGLIHIHSDEEGPRWICPLVLPSATVLTSSSSLLPPRQQARGSKVEQSYSSSSSLKRTRSLIACPMHRPDASPSWLSKEK